MQRVAIARALVNNPDIILADEPTGALDSETSLQVMEILKEIAKDRLVIMVTHNPELAEQYATRTVRMLDGVILSDSSPLTEEELAKEKQIEDDLREKAKKERKPSMSFMTSFGLSLRNLFTKKSRTILTSFAGSIGIIGIALIYAVSHGMKSYIDTVQEDTLSSTPLMLESQHVDLGSLMLTMLGAAESRGEHDNDAVYQKPVLQDLVYTINSIQSKANDLKSFKAFLESELEVQDGTSSLKNALSGVQYTYNMNLQIYTQNVDGTIVLSDTQSMIQSLLMKYMSQLNGGSLSTDSSFSSSGNSMMSMMGGTGSGMTLWQEMLPGKDGRAISDLFEKQYDLLYGSFPNSYDEVVLVVDEKNEISDMTLYALGLISEEEMDRIVNAVINKTELEVKERSWSYEEICGMEFRTVLGADCFSKDETTGLFTDLRTTSHGLKYLYDNGIKLRVSGIIRENSDATSHMLSGTIGYTSLLTEYVITKNAESAAIQAQLNDPSRDIFTDLPFRDAGGSLSDAVKEVKFREHISNLSLEQKADAFIKIACIPDPAYVEETIRTQMSSLTRPQIEAILAEALASETGMSREEISAYISSMTDDALNQLITEIFTAQLTAQYAAGVKQQLASKTSEELVAMLDAALPTYTTEACATYYDAVLTFSTSSYEENLHRLGYVNLDEPSTINLYAATFDNKDIIENIIAEYNEGRDVIRYDGH